MGSVRTTARIVRLYLALGIPARDVLRIISQIPSISRSRSGLLPSITFFMPLLAIYELVGSSTISSWRPNFSMRSRKRDSDSTDHFSSNVFDEIRLQI